MVDLMKNQLILIKLASGIFYDFKFINNIKLQETVNDFSIDIIPKLKIKFLY